MPEMSTKFVPKHKGDKNPNPKLLKFVQKVTDRIPGKLKMTSDAPEYWGLACIFEDEMDATTREASLDLLLDMLPGKPLKVREHRTYQLLHEWNAKKHYTPDDASFDELLDKLSFDKKDEWVSPIWGVEGDRVEKIPDPSRGSVLTVHYYNSTDGVCRTALASVSGQIHECRHHSIENAWKFISQFSR